MARQIRKRYVIGGMGAVALAGLLGVLGLAATGGHAQTGAKPGETPTVVLPTATPTAAPAPKEPPKQPADVPLAMPFGPITAEPYRVHTGDGDCLNVRPVPGTTFQSDPRTCVPEGFLLWLYGEPKSVDGHTWRYALGEGWVAMEFVQPAPGATKGFGPFSSVMVGGSNGESTQLARVSKDGAVAKLPTLPSALRGLGDVPPALSPDGKWAAYGNEERYVPTLTIRNMQDGTETKYPQVFLSAWSNGNRLLVRVNSNCPQQCTWTVGWLDPREGVLHELTNKQNSWWQIAWANDGQSLYVIDDGALIHVSLDGAVREIVAKRAAGLEIAWGQLSVSDDGLRLLSSPYQGAIIVVELKTGAISKVERAPQIPVGGRCGGSVGSLTTWLDANTVIWHESYAEKGGNGITISRTDGSGRRLIPFFTVGDIRKVAPSLVSFTTYENSNDKVGFQLTWLLDTTTGEARPVTVGTSPVWE
ncbi:MAG: hypothetical protein ABI577_08800 [bacterium]